jgi:hypothetical protein
MGVFEGKTLIITSIIPSEDTAIFININSFLIIARGELATDFISFP